MPALRGTVSLDRREALAGLKELRREFRALSTTPLKFKVGFEGGSKNRLKKELSEIVKVGKSQKVVIEAKVVDKGGIKVLKQLNAELAKIGKGKRITITITTSGGSQAQRNANQAAAASKRAADQAIRDAKRRGDEVVRQLDRELKAALKARREEARLSRERIREGRAAASQLGDRASSAATGGGLLIAGGLLASTREAVAFEHAFAGVRKTVKADDRVLDNLALKFRKMATEIPVATGELSKIGQTAGQLGIRTENIAKFTDVVAKLGVATNLTSETGSIQLARFANITKMRQTDFDRLGATIVDLGNNFATTEAEIASMSLRIAPVGVQMGLTQPKILAFATALSSLGVRTEAGGSSISSAFVKIQKHIKAGKKELEIVAKTAGMSGKEFKKAFADDASQAMKAFVGGLGTLKKRGGDATATLAELGLGEIRVRTSLLALAGNVGVLDHALSRSQTAWKENSALNREASIRFGTTASKAKIAENQMRDLGVTVGTTLVPALNQVFQQVSVGFHWFNSLDDATRKSAVSGAVWAAGGLLVIGRLKTTIETVMLARTAWLGLNAAINAPTAGVGAKLLGAAGVPALVLSLTAGVAAYGLWRINGEKAKETSIRLKDANRDLTVATDKVRGSFDRLSKTAMIDASAAKTVSELRSQYEKLGSTDLSKFANVSLPSARAQILFNTNIDNKTRSELLTQVDTLTNDVQRQIQAKKFKLVVKAEADQSSLVNLKQVFRQQYNDLYNIFIKPFRNGLKIAFDFAKGQYDAAGKRWETVLGKMDGATNGWTTKIINRHKLMYDALKRVGNTFWTWLQGKSASAADPGLEQPSPMTPQERADQKKRNQAYRAARRKWDEPMGPQPPSVVAPRARLMPSSYTENPFDSAPLGVSYVVNAKVRPKMISPVIPNPSLSGMGAGPMDVSRLRAVPNLKRVISRSSESYKAEGNEITKQIEALEDKLSDRQIARADAGIRKNDSQMRKWSARLTKLRHQRERLSKLETEARKDERYNEGVDRKARAEARAKTPNEVSLGWLRPNISLRDMLRDAPEVTPRSIAVAAKERELQRNGLPTLSSLKDSDKVTRKAIEYLATNKFQRDLAKEKVGAYDIPEIKVRVIAESMVEDQFAATHKAKGLRDKAMRESIEGVQNARVGIKGMVGDSSFEIQKARIANLGLRNAAGDLSGVDLAERTAAEFAANWSDYQIEWLEKYRSVSESSEIAALLKGGRAGEAKNTIDGIMGRFRGEQGIRAENKVLENLIDERKDAREKETEEAKERSERIAEVFKSLNEIFRNTESSSSDLLDSLKEIPEELRTVGDIAELSGKVGKRASIVSEIEKLGEFSTPVRDEVRSMRDDYQRQIIDAREEGLPQSERLRLESLRQIDAYEKSILALKLTSTEAQTKANDELSEYKTTWAGIVKDAQTLEGVQALSNGRNASRKEFLNELSETRQLGVDTTQIWRRSFETLDQSAGEAFTSILTREKSWGSALRDGVVGTLSSIANEVIRSELHNLLAGVFFGALGGGGTIGRGPVANGDAYARSLSGKATGIERVEKDNSIFRLHRGESVLSAAQAQRYREERAAQVSGSRSSSSGSGSGGSVVVMQYVHNGNVVANSPEEYQQQIQSAARRSGAPKRARHEDFRAVNMAATEGAVR